MKSVQASRTVRVVACLVATAALAGCPFDKPEDHLARGKAMAAKQDHAGATIEFKNYLQSNPRSAEARYLLGREFLAQGQARLAEIELQKAFDAKFDRDAVVPPLVESQLMQGQPEKIPAQFATLELRSAQANADLRSLLGSAALMQDKRDVALRYYRSAQQFAPDHVRARLGEARVKALQGDLDGAATEVATVLDKNPNQFEALLLKADIARARGQTQPAIDAYLAAARQNPDSVAAHLNLASLYVASNALDLAQQQVTTLKKLAPRHPGANYLDALIAFDKKDYLRANEAIVRSLEENPASGVAQLLSGAISLAMNQPAQAEVHLLEGLKLSPESIYGRRLLTSLYLRQRQPQKANEVLQPALKALPNDPSMLGLAGEVALQMGDYASASTLFDRSTKIDPSNTTVRVRSADIDLARGDDAAGFAALEAAAKATTSNPSPAIALVIARINRKQFDEALVAWQDLEKLQPDSPITYNLRAAIDLGRKDGPGARKALEKAIQIQPNFYPAVANLAALDESAGNLDAARQRYKTLLAKDANNTLGLIGLADFEAKHGAKADVIVPLLMQARRSAPTAQQPVVMLTKYYISQNNMAQALATAQEGLSAAPNDEAFLQLVGGLQLQAHASDQAIAAYRQLVSLKPNIVEYQIRLGQAMVQANQADVALPLFRNLLRAQPDSLPVQADTVTTFLSANRVDEASRLLADIRKLAPGSAALPELEADLKLASKQYADAATAYRKVLAQAPTPLVTMKLSQALTLAGDDPAARAVLADWMKKHPDDLAMRIFDADAALRTKDYAHAAEGYQTSLKIRPDDPVVLNNLAWTLWQQKDPTAIGYAEKARDLAPGLPSVNDTLGWMLVEQGKTKEGIALLEKASAEAPSQPAISLHLAKAQIKDGRKDAARSTLQALLKTSPGTPEGKESKDLMATL